MIKRNIVVFLAGLAAALSSQGEIVYRQGPIVLDHSVIALDLNQDGVPDYDFDTSTVADLTSPGSPSPLTPYLGTFAFNRNDYLMNSEAPDGRIVLKQAGVAFGPETIPGESWGHRNSQAQIISYAPGNSNIWLGFSGQPQEAFLGVRFLSDGVSHYGWIRFVIPPGISTPRAVIFPVITDWAYESRPNTPILAGAGADRDDDGVWDSVDQCPGTPAGAVVDTNGCSIAQLAPCDGPWKNHGEYVKSVGQAASRFMQAGLISEMDKAGIMNQAAASEYGKPKTR